MCMKNYKRNKEIERINIEQKLTVRDTNTQKLY